MEAQSSLHNIKTLPGVCDHRMVFSWSISMLFSYDSCLFSLLTVVPFRTT